jgi:hypothetical protein
MLTVFVSECKKTLDFCFPEPTTRVIKWELWALVGVCSSRLDVCKYSVHWGADLECWHSFICALR